MNTEYTTQAARAVHLFGWVSHDLFLNHHLEMRMVANGSKTIDEVVKQIAPLYPERKEVGVRLSFGKGVNIFEEGLYYEVLLYMLGGKLEPKTRRHLSQLVAEYLHNIEYRYTRIANQRARLLANKSDGEGCHHLPV